MENLVFGYGRRCRIITGSNNLLDLAHPLKISAAEIS
jgi:hypothetical protein